MLSDQGAATARLYKFTQTDLTGNFRFADIAPNTYTVFAWEALEQFAYFDQKLIKQFETQGRPIRVGPSENVVVQDMKLISLQEVVAAGF